jgi:thermitase
MIRFVLVVALVAANSQGADARPSDVGGTRLAATSRDGQGGPLTASPVTGPLDWSHKIAPGSQSGKIDHDLPFEPGVIQVIHTSGTEITQLLEKHGVPGSATRVHRELTRFKVEAGLDRSYRVTVPVGTEKVWVTALAPNRADFIHVGLFWIESPRLAYMPTDPLFGTQGNLGVLRMQQAWDYQRGNTAIIALVDSGLTGGHEDFGNSSQQPSKQVSGWDHTTGTTIGPGSNSDPTSCGHGTRATGTAAAATDNAKGLAAPGFNARVMPIKVWMDIGGVCTFWSTNLADRALPIEKAVALGAHTIHIAHISSAYSADEELAIRNAWTVYGRSVVNPAGNDGVEVTSTLNVRYPCVLPYVMCVAATDNTPAFTSWTAYGSAVDYAAPGLNVYTATPGTSLDYHVWSGTSAAAPHVSGVAALLRDRGCLADRQHQALWNTATAISNPPKYVAAGFVNAGSALPYWPAGC